MCPPERPRSGVSIRKEHIPTCKEGFSIHKRCMLTPKHVCAFADGCALVGRHGRAHRRRPYQPPSNPSSGNHFLCLSVGELFAGNLGTRSHTRNGRGGACVPARTSAQRRFHPQRARSHPQKWRFHLLSPPYIIGRRGVYILRHLIIYINHARAHCPSCGIMRQCCVFHGEMLFSRTIACVSWHDHPRLPRQRGGNRGDDRAARPQGCPCRPTSPRVIATRTLCVARLAAAVWRCRDLDRRAARPSYPHRIRLPASRRACRNGRAQKLAGHHRQRLGAGRGADCPRRPRSTPRPFADAGPPRCCERNIVCREGRPMCA